jgi:signal transduction histidine kinase
MPRSTVPLMLKSAMSTTTSFRSLNEIETFMAEYYAAWGGTDEDRIMSYYAENVTVQIPGRLMQGQSAVRERFVRPFITAFAGNRHFVKNIVLGRGVAFIEFVFKAEHTGPFEGHAPTDANIELPGCGVYEYDSARRQITAARIYFDVGTLLQQIIDQHGRGGDSAAPADPIAIAAPTEHLDLATVIDLSQTISGEVVVEKLVDTLLRRAFEDRTQALARLQQMQSDFAHMNRVSMMGELAASLSHEIAQPIASARNNARAALNFLKMQPPDLGEVREALSCVVADADRSGEIIDRIRQQIKKAPPRKERFDLNAAINEVIVLAHSVTLRNGVSVQTRLAEGLRPVLGDRVQLQQVMLNLVLNAAEAMGSVEEGARELLISSEQDQAGVLVAVRDSGPGIDPANLDRVFDTFYTTKSSGTGMGLSICRSIIHAHGGKLWAEANEPRGAVFQFTLPAAEEDS